jgi:hypothetical protein
VRVQLLIDIDTEDLPRLQKYVGEQPAIFLQAQDGWGIWGRFVGAKEAIDGLHDPAMMDPYDRQAERDKKK